MLNQLIKEKDFSHIGFCEIENKPVIESFCLTECESSICFRYPFDVAKKRKCFARHKKYALKFAVLRKAFFGHCWFCGSTVNLEFAHRVPTGLEGRGRGQPQRYHDIAKNPCDYLLACYDCHLSFDRGQLSLEALKY